MMLILWAFIGHTAWLLVMCDTRISVGDLGPMPTIISMMVVSWVLGPIVWLLALYPKRRFA